MAVTLKKISSTHFVINGKTLIKDAHGNWMPNIALTSFEMKTFDQYLSKCTHEQRHIRVMEVACGCETTQEECIACGRVTTQPKTEC